MRIILCVCKYMINELLLIYNIRSIGGIVTNVQEVPRTYVCVCVGNATLVFLYFMLISVVFLCKYCLYTYACTGLWPIEAK